MMSMSSPGKGNIERVCQEEGTQNIKHKGECEDLQSGLYTTHAVKNERP